MIRFFHCESRKFLAQQSKTVADVSGGLRTPPSRSNFFYFHAVSAKILPNCKFAHPWVDAPASGKSKSVVAPSRIAQSVERLPDLTLSTSMIAPSFKSHQCLTGTWKRWLGCHAGCQEVDRCCTRGESRGTCNTYASTMHE